MGFPAGTISTNDIRSNLAVNNTAGAQTNVALNDGPVRAAADKLSGAVSYNDLRGKNIFLTADITWGYKVVGQFEFWGYSPPSLYPYENLGSIANTTSYYTLPNSQSFSLYDVYNNNNDTDTTRIQSTGVNTSIQTANVTVYIDGTKYSLVAYQYDSSGWQFYGDVLSLTGRTGTSRVTVVYG